MQLSVIIVNYNVQYFTEQCLYSVQRACKNLVAEIIVVDNCSTDNSKDHLGNTFENVLFIWNKENLGFSKANNIGLQRACGEYILFLNPDTIIPEDCLEKCLAFYQGKKGIGAMGVRMIDGSGAFLKESKRSFPSLSTSFFKLSGLASLCPHSALFARYYLGNLPDDINHRVPVLSGAFMIAAKSLLDEMHGFDEAFFMYGEDIDLSYRIQQAGYKNYYFAASTIIHFKGESTKKNSRYVRLFYGAMKLFVHKHYGVATAVLYGIFISIAGAAKAFTTMLMLPFSGKKITGRDALPALIAGHKKDCEAVKVLLNNAGAGLKIVSVVDIADNACNPLQQINELINANEIAAVIFCIDGLMAEEAILLMQRIHPKVNYLFYHAGSSGIVGSGNKNMEGDWIAL